jgi:hypothetical protein
MEANIFNVPLFSTNSMYSNENMLPSRNQYPIIDLSEYMTQIFNFSMQKQIKNEEL